MNRQVLINGKILDGTKDMVVKEGLDILVEDGVIQAIEPNISKDNATLIDLKGSYILPGLINMHVHLPASGKPKKKQSDPKKLVKLILSNGLFRKVGVKLCEGYARTELYSGVTTIRTVGGVADFDTIIRDTSKNVPRILASNMAVSCTDGHMVGSLGYEARTAKEAHDYVELIAKDKPDLIKLMITGGVLDAKEKGEPGVLKMAPELVKAACDKAHEVGLMVASHVESTEGVQVAIKNGVDTIEHGAKPTPEIIELMKQRNASHICTISPALPFALFDPAISHVSEMEQFNGKVVFDGSIEMAKECLDNGILVGLGTDTGCPYVTHYNMWRELYFYHHYVGVSNAFALHTATFINAKIAKIDDITGSIEVGKSADFMVVKNNPLDSLVNLKDPQMVMIKGNLIKEPKVKKMANVEVELDKFIFE